MGRFIRSSYSDHFLRRAFQDRHLQFSHPVNHPGPAPATYAFEEAKYRVFVAGKASIQLYGGNHELVWCTIFIEFISLDHC